MRAPLFCALVAVAYGGVWTNCRFWGAGCPGGWYRTAICTCQDCSPGRYCPSGGKSYWHRPHCPAGRYTSSWRQSYCHSCPRGKYQPHSGKSYCHSCPSGKYSSGSGWTGCSNCPSGKYQPHGTKHYCHTCPAGKYSHSGWANCGNCPGGKYQPYTHKSYCYGCPSGKYSHSGWTSCSTCPGGKYAGGSWSSCSTCPAGKYSHSGWSSCSGCPGGKYSPSGASSCHTCPGGKYAGSSSGSCPSCPAGKYSHSGWTSCGSCPGGKYSPSASTSCSTCPSGKYAGSSSGSCTTCPAGKASGSGSSSCGNCPSGKYSGSGASSCSNCPSGKYQPNSGRSSCSSCPSGKYQPHTAKTNCYSCPSGKYQPSSGRTSCSTCPSGKYSGSGRSSCSNCPAGKYQPSSGRHFCYNCPNGKYSNTASSSCYTCPSGKYKGSSGCSNCPSGKYSGSGSTSCALCPAGKYQNLATQSSCKNCAAGHYQNAAGKTSCKACEPGASANAARTGCIEAQPGEEAFCTLGRVCGYGLGNCSVDAECHQNLRCTAASCFYAGSSCCMRRTAKTNKVCGDHLPGTEYFRRGYSALVGKPIYEAEAQKAAIFDFSCTAGNKYQSWLLYDDVDATIWSRCLSNGRDASVHSSFSTGTLDIEGKGAEIGYDKTWTTKVGVEYKGLSASVETENRLALQFSKSRTTEDGKKRSKEAFSRKIEAHKREKWYTAELLYQQAQLTDNFKQATYALAKNFNEQVLSWFTQFGGWALLKADLGSFASRSMFIKRTASSNQVDWLENEVKTWGFEAFGFSAGQTKSTTTQTATYRNNMKQTGLSQTRVIGYLPRKFGSCGAGFEGARQTTAEPVPVRWGLVPLWNDGIPLQTIQGLTWTEVKNLRTKLETFVFRIQKGGELCASTYCNNRGVCTAQPKVFQAGAYFDATQTHASKYLAFWNGDTCLCKSGWSGRRCETSATFASGNMAVGQEAVSVKAAKRSLQADVTEPEEVVEHYTEPTPENNDAPADAEVTESSDNEAAPAQTQDAETDQTADKMADSVEDVAIEEPETYDPVEKDASVPYQEQTEASAGVESLEAAGQLDGLNKEGEVAAAKVMDNGAQKVMDGEQEEGIVNDFETDLAEEPFHAKMATKETDDDSQI